MMYCGTVDRWPQKASFDALMWGGGDGHLVITLSA